MTMGTIPRESAKWVHNSYEHMVDWDSSNFALSREPGAIVHFPGYLPGQDRSEVRDITWTTGSENGMNRQEVLRSVGGRPLGTAIVLARHR